MRPRGPQRLQRCPQRPPRLQRCPQRPPRLRRVPQRPPRLPRRPQQTTATTGDYHGAHNDYHGAYQDACLYRVGHRGDGRLGSRPHACRRRRCSGDLSPPASVVGLRLQQTLAMTSVPRPNFSQKQPNEDRERELICFLVLAHKEPAQVGRLAERLAPNRVLLHVDKRVGGTVWQAFAGLPSQHSNVEMLPRYRSGWASWGLAQATLSGIQHTVTGSFSHLVVMTGQDYLLRPLTEIQSLFASQPDVSWVVHDNIPVNWIGDKDGGVSRVTHWHLAVKGRRGPGALAATRAPGEIVPLLRPPAVHALCLPRRWAAGQGGTDQTNSLPCTNGLRMELVPPKLGHQLFQCLRMLSRPPFGTPTGLPEVHIPEDFYRE